MATGESSTDRGVGFAVLFVLLGLAGALVVFVGGLAGNQLAAAWGLAAALLAGGVVVAGLHLA